MNFYENKIEITLENFGKIKFNYAYNKFTTFQDLLEFVALLCPRNNICPCFRFKYKGYEGYREISNTKTIFSFDKKLRELYLFNSRRGDCFCEELTKDYLKQSKIYIINELNKKIEYLSRKLQNNEKEIDFLEKEKKEDKNQIFSLKKENDYNNNQINSLIFEKEKQKDNINSLEHKIKKIESDNQSKIELLNKEKAVLEMAVDGNFEIEKFCNLGINLNNIKAIKKDKISIGKDNNIIVEKADKLFNKKDFINFYDVIIDIKSIKDITKGWEIKMKEETIKKYEEYKTQKIIKIGVIGNSNKGKSFLLSKISKITLPSGTSIRTEGLSIKYPELGLFKDRKIVLLDSAGLETPVLKKENEENTQDEEIEENNEENNEANQNNGKEKLDIQKEPGEMANNQEENGNTNNLNKQKEKKDDFFQEKSREKLITELFLQKYIIKYSDILIIVVGILTYSEQKLLNRIKLEIQRAKINKTLFIIHNLITYTSIEQVEEYTQDYLLKSATFNLEEGHYISTKLGNKPGKYYYEKNTTPKVFHLLFANEGSEAGKKYNTFTLDFLERNYQTVTDLTSFDAIETVKERFNELSSEIIEKIEEVSEKVEFDNSNQNLIKLKSPKIIKLKKCLIDELGFSNLRANSFQPLYNCFKKNDKYIIRIEIPGNSDIDSSIDRSGEISVIKLYGEKKKDKEPQNLKDNKINTREFGKFNVEIPVNLGDCIISNEEPEIKKVNGVCIFEYKLDFQKITKGLKTEQKDEI